jgi:hypothetical protein
MQRVLIATLMALFFGLFSMPAVQAAPANGWAVGSAVKAISPLETIYYRSSSSLSSLSSLSLVIGLLYVFSLRAAGCKLAAPSLDAMGEKTRP